MAYWPTREGGRSSWSLLDLEPKVLPVTQKDVELTRYYCQRYREAEPRDLVHLAVMLNNDIGRIISVDRHFDLTELKRWKGSIL